MVQYVLLLTTQPAPQLPGLEIELADVPAFAQNVMCQHYIISYGDNTAVMENLCNILGIKIIKSKRLNYDLHFRYCRFVGN